ncbi:MAG: 3-hydroxyacyl-CoA dehydrogenase [Ramlibacter sp.]|nr:3-hydroxyacyl-CoA dehydrogenase [Ramlibacter sp.]
MIDFTGRVALVTGAGAGLGRQHALALAARGAKVVVNDMPRAGGPSPAAEVAREIEAAGGTAMGFDASVTDPQAVKQMVDAAVARFGGIDILVNNAGFLRDKSFAKMEADDFKSVLDVHLMGAFHCTKAVWDGMKARNYGRIVMTTSSSGLWGNFGQANYGAAKMALVGLMQTLSIEGAKNNIRVNCLAPTAATAMTEGLIPPAMMEALAPGAVTPGLLFLASEDAPTRAILCAGAGTFASAQIVLTGGVHVGTGPSAAEAVQAQFAAIADRQASQVPEAGVAQSQNEMAKFEQARKL